MIEVFDGLALWDQVAPRLKNGQLRAAVAYIGAGAHKYLGLRKGDVLVFDGDRKSVAQGHVDLKEVRSMLAAGVRLYSRAGLHSKMMVVESATPVALVGSANASRNSATRKSETVVVFDDPDAVQSVRDAIAGLTVGLTPLTRSWADSMIEFVPQRRPADTTFRRVVNVEVPLAKRTRPMWLWTYAWAPERYYSTEVNAAVAQAQAARGVVVEPFALRGSYSGQYDAIAIGDSVVLIPWPLEAKAPRRNGRVMEPALVIDKIDRRSGRGGDVLLAWRHNASAVRYGELAEAFVDSGVDLHQGRLPAEERRVIFELFAGVA